MRRLSVFESDSHFGKTTKGQLCPKGKVWLNYVVQSKLFGWHWKINIFPPVDLWPNDLVTICSVRLTWPHFTIFSIEMAARLATLKACLTMPGTAHARQLLQAPRQMQTVDRCKARAVIPAWLGNNSLKKWADHWSSYFFLNFLGQRATNGPQYTLVIETKRWNAQRRGYILHSNTFNGQRK